jgi:cytidylate kinase
VNVAFAGLTAAGKTTHARLLAEQLGYSYVSATETLLGILDIDAPGEQIWFDRYDEIQAARQGDAVDDELDRSLAALAVHSEATVFDTWALAWVSPSPMVRVWIESDEESRARKCLVSQRTNRLPLEDCRDLVHAKDGHTRGGFLRRHGFDLFTDRARYGLVLCNSHLIGHATRSCADAGIEAFAPVVRETVTALLEQRPDHELADIARQHPQEVLRIRPW